MVIATQNPIEYEGTFALPEAQLDRFMLRLRLGYPQPLEEISSSTSRSAATRSTSSREVVSASRSCARCRPAVREIYVDSAVSDYIVRLVNATRDAPRRLPRRLAARLARAVPRRPGVRRAGRPRLRHPRRRQGARRAGAGPPADRQDRGHHPRRRLRAPSCASCSTACPIEAGASGAAASDRAGPTGLAPASDGRARCSDASSSSLVAAILLIVARSRPARQFLFFLVYLGDPRGRRLRTS